MAAKSMSLLFVVLSILVVSSLSEAGTIVGNYQPIRDLKDPRVVGIAKFAVTEHNRQAKTNLELVTIVKGEVQVVAGLRYRLIITTKDGAAAKPVKYTAVVVTQAWSQTTKLEYFEKTIDLA